MFFYYMGYALFFILGNIPMYVGVLLARSLALVAYHVDKRHREVCRKNLILAFGEELGEKRIKEISIGAYNNLFLSIVEFAQFSFMPKKKIRERVTLVNFQSYLDAEKKGKGTLLCTGHFSSWEVLAMVGSTIKPMTVIVRSLDNEGLNKVLVHFRSLRGNKIIPKKNSLRTILKSLKNNGAIGLLIDQNCSVDEGIFVPFFGRLASTVKAPVEIALKTGATMLPIFINRVSPGKFIMDYGKPIELVKTGDHKRDVYNGLLKFNQAIENKIREYPEQWFWMHRRWKVRPSEEEHGEESRSIY